MRDVPRILRVNARRSVAPETALHGRNHRNGPRVSQGDFSCPHFAVETETGRRGLGTVLTAPCDVILDETTILQPDLLCVSAARSSIITRRAVEGAPDLVVEILSDSTAARDRGAKMKLYARYGVARYWIIDIDARTLEIHSLHAGEYVLDANQRAEAVVPCDVPPGLELRLAEIWPG